MNGLLLISVNFRKNELNSKNRYSYKVLIVLKVID